MKKVIPIVLMTLIMLTSFQRTTVADDSLQIERVASQTLKNSQVIKKSDKEMALANKNYQSTKASMDALKFKWKYVGSFSMYANTVIGPMARRSQLDAAANAQRVTNNKVRFSAYEKYVSLLKAKFAIETQIKLRNATEADNAITQEKSKLGLVSDSQVRLAEIVYKQARLEADSAQKIYNTAAMAVNNLMGEDLTKQYDVVQGDNIFPASRIRPLEEYTNAAAVSRAEVINAQNNLDLLKKQFEYGSTGIKTDHAFYLQKTQNDIKGLEYNLDLKKISVQQDVIGLYLREESAMKSFEAMKELAALNQQKAEAAVIQYSNGSLSLLDLNNARINQAKADINLKNAELDLWLAQVKLDMASDIGI